MQAIEQDGARRPNAVLLVVILGALTSISPFAIDMYLPALPLIAGDLGTSVARVSLSLSSYFIGLGVGQLFYGPLLDRFGRKKPVYVGLVIYMIAALLCTLAQDAGQLVGLRFLQAIGGCAAQVAAMAMVHDFFAEKDRSRIISLMMLVLGAAPLLAPTIGGFVAAEWGWRAVFVILAGIAGTIMVAAGVLLPEGHKPDPGISLRPGPIFRTYGTILRERVFYTYATAGALSFAGLFTYVAGSPIIFMDVFAVSPQVYGGIFALLATGFIGGSQFNIRLSKKYKSAQIFRAAIFSQSVWATLFLIATLTGVVNIYIAIGCLFMTMASVGTSYPNAAALALAPFNRNAGSAAGLLGVVQICGGAGASSLIGIMNADTLLPVVAILAVTAWGAAAVLLAGGRYAAPLSAVAGGESL